MINKSNLKVLIALAFTLLAIAIPWEEFRSSNFADRQVYLEYAAYGTNRLDYVDFDAATSYIVNEALWHLLIKLYTLQEGFNVEEFFQLISIFSLAVFSIFIVKRFHPAWLLLLLNPLVLDFVLSQYRSALALGLIGLAVIINRRYFSAILLILVPFIHTASLIFIAFILAAKVLARFVRDNQVSWRHAIILSCFVGVLAALVTGPFRETILTAFNDRRAVYNAETASTFLYSSFWMMLLGMIFLQKKTYFENPVNLYSIAILSLVTVNYFTAGYSTRFLAASFPALMSSMLSMSKNHRSFAVGIYSLYVAVQWLFWSGTRSYLF